MKRKLKEQKERINQILEEFRDKTK